MEVDDSDVESVAGDDVMDTTAEASKSVYSKDMWQIRLLPYADEFRKNADEHFSYIKTGLSRAILHRDSRPGLVYWTQEIERYINFYDRRFTKVDHIRMVELLYNVVVAEKLDFSIVQAVCRCLVTLLSRKNLLTRDDLRLDWRPLYKLYYEISYKNLEEEGVFLLPENFKRSLDKLLHYARTYWTDSATQEILDEIRPFLCPFDEVYARGLGLAYHFLPTCLTREEHERFGASLWFDEFWHWYAEADSPANSEAVFIQLFGKLARDSPFYIDWTGKIDIVFGHLLRSLKLQVGSEQVNVWTGSSVFNHVSQLIVYNLGGEKNVAQLCLDKLFLTLRDYFHPSNSGSHTGNLLSFVLLLSTEVVNRISRERYYPKKHVIKVPAEYRLTDQHIDAFVKSVLPCLEYAAFTKVKHEYVMTTFRLLAFLSPGLVVPAVLDLVYPALDVITEPHRLQQSLSILGGILVTLVRDNPNATAGERRPLTVVETGSVDSHRKSLRIHAISIVSSLVPAIDLNDTIKTVLALQIIGMLVQLIHVADCSEAIHVRDDLTDEEKELCSATARFDDIVDQLLHKLFTMIEVFGTNPATQNTHNRRHNLSRTQRVSAEELIMERGVVGVFRGLLKNCSGAVYDRVFKFFFEFLKQNTSDSRPIMETMRCLLPMFCINNPEKAFPCLFDYIYGRLKSLVTEETLLEDEVESQVIWYLNLLSEVGHAVPGVVITSRRAQIDELITICLRFRCKDAISAFGRFIQHFLAALVSFYPKRTFDPKAHNDLSTYLPIRHWAEPIDKATWQLNWTVPTEKEIAYAQEVVNKIVFTELDRLREPAEIDKLSNNDLHKRLSFVRVALLGVSKLMPFFDDKPVQQFSTEPVGLYVPTIFTPANMPTMKAADGQNLRRVTFARIKELAKYVLKHRENDSKSMIEIIAILRILLLVRGLDDKTLSPLLASHKAAKVYLQDPIRGASAELSGVAEDSIQFIHARRCIHKHPLSMTETHVEAFRLLIELSTCAYTVVRVPAQRVLDACFTSFARSYAFVVDDIIRFIRRDAKSTHEQFKGALYLLQFGKARSIMLRQSWPTLLTLWPAIVDSQYSEKPSIVSLIDNIHDLVVTLFASFEIRFTFPDKVVALAERLREDYEGCVHSSAYPGFTYMSADEAKASEQRRNAENERNYYKLCGELVRLCLNTSLHWRHIEIAQSFISLLLRRDIEYPREAVSIFTKLLASDHVQLRKTAIGLLSSWLRINKPKSVRVELDVDKGANKPGAKWPIRYGVREDNAFLLWRHEDAITTEAAWNSTRFHAKAYVSFYTWPAHYRVYEAPAKQVNHNRDASAFTPTERDVLTMLTDRAHLARVLKLMAVEERKGSEEFNSASYAFFYGLTRTFGLYAVDALKPFVEEYIGDKRDSSQRLAAEMVAGIIKGARLWTCDKQTRLQAWLRPLLVRNFEAIRNEVENLWASMLVSAFYDCEPRQIAWLYDALMELWQQRVENSYLASARLYFLHCATQWEWRMFERWSTLVNIVKPLMGQSLQNVRTRAGGVIADACQYDFPHMYVVPSIEQRLRPVSYKHIAEMVKAHVPKLFANARDGIISASSSDVEMEASSALTPSTRNAKTEAAIKREKLIFLTYLSALTHSLAEASQPHVLDFLPVLAHYCNDTRDDELRNACNLIFMHVMSVAHHTPRTFKYLVSTLAQSLQRCSWWKSRVMLLKFMQVAIFANLYVAHNAVEEISELLFQLLKDAQLEVRVAASDTLSQFIRWNYIKVDKRLTDSTTAMTRGDNEPLTRHAGVLALSSIVLAYPYTVPAFMPDVLMAFCRFASERQPIHGTVKTTLSHFKRTHQECWHEHKQKFTDDQLAILTGLLVSPNYYV